MTAQNIARSIEAAALGVKAPSRQECPRCLTIAYSAGDSISMSRRLVALLMLVLPPRLIVTETAGALRAQAAPADDLCPGDDTGCPSGCTQCLCLCCPLRVVPPSAALTPEIRVTAAKSQPFPPEVDPVLRVGTSDILDPPRA